MKDAAPLLPAPPRTAMARTRRWVEVMVLGHNLCPFAHAPWGEGRVRVAVTRARSAPGALRFALAEAALLLDTPQAEVSNTLVVVPHALGDFESFLDAAATLEDLLAEAGAEGVLQVATFHPDYRFEGAPTDDPANATNRAPHPTFHLLREDEISRATATVAHAEGIPARNVAHLRALGAEAIAAFRARFAAR